MKSQVFPYNSIIAQDLGGGVTRKILAYCPEMMIVEVSFEKGGTGAMHKHPHIQNTYVKEGVFLGYCAQIVGLSKGDFIRFLGENKISIFRYDSEDELMEDIRNA